MLKLFYLSLLHISYDHTLSRILLLGWPKRLLLAHHHHLTPAEETAPRTVISGPHTMRGDHLSDEKDLVKNGNKRGLEVVFV